MTCENCLHYEVCNYHISEETNLTVAECTHFADHSEWVHLPCKVGDKVWYIHRQPDTLLRDICETEVHIIALRDDGFHIYVTSVFSGFLEKEIGKKLFLAREEAEKALETSKG